MKTMSEERLEELYRRSQASYLLKDSVLLIEAYFEIRYCWEEISRLRDDLEWYKREAVTRTNLQPPKSSK